MFPKIPFFYWKMNIHFSIKLKGKLLIFFSLTAHRELCFGTSKNKVEIETNEAFF